MLHCKDTKQLRADTESKGGWKAGNICCLPRLSGGKAVPVLKLLPAELQICSFFGKQLLFCPLGQSTGFIQPCSVIQLAVAQGRYPRSSIKRLWLCHRGCSGGEVTARNLWVVTSPCGKAQLTWLRWAKKKECENTDVLSICEWRLWNRSWPRIPRKPLEKWNHLSVTRVRRMLHCKGFFSCFLFLRQL